MLTAHLKVLPNPWHAVDHVGRPAGAFAKERHTTTIGHQGYVGASLVTTTPIARDVGDIRTPDQDNCWHFSKEPATVPATLHYQKALRTGEILPADERTARRVGIAYLPFDAAVKAERDRAEAKWKLVAGDPLPSIDPFVPPQPGVHPDDITPVTSAALRTLPKQKDAE